MILWEWLALTFALRDLLPIAAISKLEKARETAVKLIELVEQMETHEALMEREEHWSRNVHWTSTTQWILADVVGGSPNSLGSSTTMFQKVRTKEVAQVRLCCIGLILESCFTQGLFPNRWTR